MPRTHPNLAGSHQGQEGFFQIQMWDSLVFNIDAAVLYIFYHFTEPLLPTSAKSAHPYTFSPP